MTQEFRVVLRLRPVIQDVLSPADVRALVLYEFRGSDLGEPVIEEVTSCDKPHEEER